MSEQYDDLDAYIEKQAVKNPTFPQMVDAALKERRLLRKPAARRRREKAVPPCHSK